MKELNYIEVEQVSGAGIIDDVVTVVGQGIGSAVELFGITGASVAGAAVGHSIGQTIEAPVNKILDTIQNISSSISHIINGTSSVVPPILPLPGSKN